MYPRRHQVVIGRDLHIPVQASKTCLDKPCCSLGSFSNVVTGQRTRIWGIEADAGEYIQDVLVVVEAEATHLSDPASDACFEMANLSVLNHSDLEQMLHDNFCERVFPEIRSSGWTSSRSPVANVGDQPFGE